MARVTDTRERLLEAALELIWKEGLGAASVDDICLAAQVRKGSFYHFFKSKADLVIAALEAHFESSRREFDRIFSPSVPPVERLRGFFSFMLERQTLRQERAGRVLGCPYASVGVSCSSEDESIRERIKQIFVTYMKYFESALRDGSADGSIRVVDVPMTVQAIFDQIEGAMAAARIQDSLGPIRNLGPGVFMMLGLEWKPVSQAARI